MMMGFFAPRGMLQGMYPAGCVSARCGERGQVRFVVAVAGLAQRFRLQHGRPDAGMGVFVAQNRGQQVADLQVGCAHGQFRIAVDGTQFALNGRLHVGAEVTGGDRTVRRAGDTGRADAQQRGLQARVAVFVADDADDELAELLRLCFVCDLGAEAGVTDFVLQGILQLLAIIRAKTHDCSLPCRR